jgi:hypothetical protein
MLLDIAKTQISRYFGSVIIWQLDYARIKKLPFDREENIDRHGQTFSWGWFF